MQTDLKINMPPYMNYQVWVVLAKWTSFVMEVRSLNASEPTRYAIKKVKSASE